MDCEEDGDQGGHDDHDDPGPLAAFAGYVVLMPLVGFRPSTALFVLALQAALEPEPRRHWLRIVLVAAITVWLTHLVFEGYLSVLLPRGRWTGF